MRDYALETTFDIKFTSRRFSTGAPYALSGGVISAYPDNSTTQITAGITLTADFDGVTGLNNIRVVATAANGYAAGSNYSLVITTGTVDGVSVEGEVVGEFSIEAQSALRPTVPLRKLDVSSGGEAGIDWANIGSPTTSVGLSGTTVKTATDVETDTQDIQSRLPAALTAGGNIKSDALAISGDTVAADNAESFFDGTGYAGTGNVIPTVTNVTNSVGLTAGAIQGIWDALTSALTTVGSVGKMIVDIAGYLDTEVAAIKAKTDQMTFTNANKLDSSILAIADLATAVCNKIRDTILSDATTFSGADIATIKGYLDTEIAAIKAKTDNLPASPAATGDAMNLTAQAKSDVNAEVVDCLGVDTISELSQAAPTATPTIKTGLMLLYMALRNKATQSSTAKKIFNDAGTNIATKVTSDDGTTYTEAEMGAGS